MGNRIIEALIFMLTTALLVSAGVFIHLYRSSHQSIAFDLNAIPGYKEDVERIDEDAAAREYIAIIQSAGIFHKPPPLRN